MGEDDIMKVCQENIRGEIKRVMTERNVTPTELARMIRSSRQYVNEILVGDSAVSLRKLALVADILDADIDVRLVARKKGKEGK